ncbi:hypothetical protein [Ferruginibacter sp. SUN106]|uniref:hypothetical protein n=1 Tax=Ferruginibacter sp. SUN106 TaxID=2978348 RepID=UPI003D36FF95
MKKRHPLLFVNLLVLLLSVACNLGTQTRTISTSDGTASLKIEYRGEVFFNAEETAIDEISPGGHVKYKLNDNQLTAEPDDSGIVSYKLYFGERRMDLNDTAAKEFFKTAMNDIADHYQR